MYSAFRSILIPSLVGLMACGGDSTGPGSRNPDPAVTGTGTPVGTMVTATIGPAGGILNSEDSRVHLTIPAGALDSNTVIGIQRVSAEAPGSVRAYRLTPDGLTFADEVTAQMYYDSALAAGSAPQLMTIATQLANGTWELLPDSAVTLDTSSASFTFRTTHFSDYTMVQGIQLRPPYAEVDPGQSVALTVKYCTRVVETSGDNFSAFSIDCDDAPSLPDEDDLPALPAYRVDPASWAVNGTQGGNAAMGFAAGDAGSGEYVAPQDPPAINPAVVSVRARRGSEQVTIVAYIKVKNSCDALGQTTRAAIRADCYPELLRGVSTTTITDASPTYSLRADVDFNYYAAGSIPGHTLVYRASGVSHFEALNSCFSVSPSTYNWSETNPSAGGVLTINLQDSTWTVEGTSLWSASYQDTCEGTDPFTAGAGGVWVSGAGDLNPEYDISGTQSDNVQTYDFSFGPVTTTAPPRAIRRR
jgi:hypothetical protein